MSAAERIQSSDTAGDLEQDLQSGVLRVVMNRPERRNSLSERMIEALQSALDQASSNPAVRVVILAAKGPAFCAGHDLKEVLAHRADADAGKAYFTWLMNSCSRMMQSITACPKPVIAEVHGVATAAGCQLVASCDLALAAETAQFATPGVNIGLFCSTPMIPLSRNVAPKHAMEMLLTGDMISANDAARIGLINRVTAPDDLTRETRDLASRIASKSMATIGLGKAAFYQQRILPLAEAYAYGSHIMVENMGFSDAGEGIGAFVAKRPARWTDS
ncbi:enoyl-CoA hydratase [Rhodoligotrophos appendicifer]|uniref:enoyl-CoA hydratase n=2 Tax=Rhodoligotrophos appendicifer TaxID=987056 RepID=UPI001185A7E8|nr:enoyl-CoA hydratase [Rhodoligotrophos appendicifer]